MKYHIRDCTGKPCFNGIEFDSFEEAWGYIYENDPMPDDAEEDTWYYDDYFVEEITEEND